MLLAPGSRKSLAAIGKLYGEDFNKIQISNDDLENLGVVLMREREMFIEYALRDAVITLIHACWMEDFNFNSGGVGIPLSLSSLGRRYVKEKHSGWRVSIKGIKYMHSTC